MTMGLAVGRCMYALRGRAAATILRILGLSSGASTTGEEQRRQKTKRVSASMPTWGDRKSTRLNSSHANISYAVFCLKKKNTYCIYGSCTYPGFRSRLTTHWYLSHRILYRFFLASVSQHNIYHDTSASASFSHLHVLS